ncbi:unnamed protein product [Parajaminaea phylloscopi]
MRAIAHATPSDTTVPALRKACDECHAVKVRCVPKEEDASADAANPAVSGTSACQRCHRLSLRCVFSPKEVPIKRKKRKLPAEPLQRSWEEASHAESSPAAWSSLVGSSVMSEHPTPLNSNIAGPSVRVNGPGTALSAHWPAPPAVPDLHANQWEEWFRTLGTATAASAITVRNSALQEGIDDNAVTAGNGLQSQTITPADTPIAPLSGQAAQALSDPCLDWFNPPSDGNAWSQYLGEALKTVGPMTPAQDLASFSSEMVGAASPHPSASSLSYPPWRSIVSELSPASLPPQGASAAHRGSVAAEHNAPLRSPGQSIEAQLSAICVDFSAALDLCDPGRMANSAEDTDRRDASQSIREGEGQLLSLFVRAEAAWTEVENMGRARIVVVREAIQEQRKHKSAPGHTVPESPGETPSPESRIGPSRNPLDRKRSVRGNIEKPLSSAGSMLALSLSFQMLDALKLLDGLLERESGPVGRSPADDIVGSTPTRPPIASVRDQAATILAPMRIDACRLPAALLVPLLTSLHEHYTLSLRSSLQSVISHARDWHEYEGAGCGPHHFCAVQVQGKRMVQELELLTEKAGRRSARARGCTKTQTAQDTGIDAV